MKLLLDTHILLWALADDPKLPIKARSMIEDEKHDVYFSLLSLWEIEIKHLLHPDRMKTDAGKVRHYCLDAGYRALSLRADHILYLKKLSRAENSPPHKDPFDRMLICQACTEDMLLLTHDELLRDYEESSVFLV